MLKKNNKILVGCLALLLVMAVGYALFSEKITINGTATAKGEFNMDITCYKGLPDVLGTNYEAYYPPVKTENNYNNDSCTVNGNNVNISANLLAPGAVRYFVVKITNNGTIDAILSDYKIKNRKLCIDGYDGGNKNGIIEENECGVEFEENVIGDDTDIVQLVGEVGFEKADGTLYSYFSNNGNLITESVLDEFIENETFVFKPGESIYLWYKAEVSSYFEDEDNKLNLKFESSESYTFSQPTNN